eukprot:TRINITY_DN74185_c0_g1_i1.p1 TRINITY_DN74185_c0_g1~~TRINITY_DN74185_c0_g1_i1.p1  ORF type:complete len:301 (-),score=46.99 TRINITY_DN74185_c0_g1_i1:147-1049(-)
MAAWQPQHWPEVADAHRAPRRSSSARRRVAAAARQQRIGDVDARQSMRWRGAAARPVLLVLAVLSAALVGRAQAADVPRCDLGGSAAYTVGESMLFCIFLSTNPLKKMILRLKVDDHADVVLGGAHKLTTTGATTHPVYTWMSTTQDGTEPAYPLDCTNSMEVDRRGHLVSCPQVYTTSTHVSMVQSLVINLQAGRVLGFAWDNGCAGCSPSECMQVSKRFDVNKSAASSETFEAGLCGENMAKCSADGSCDMKVLVTWAGTDAKGRNLLSASVRLSKFTGATIRSLYETMNENYKGQAR